MFESFSSIWWIFPILMIVLCIFMMRGRMGSMCGHGSHGGTPDSRHADASDSASDILDKRYARGEINRDEYKEKKKALTRQG
jgi:putative membrane protein